ncbi:tetratricopeptide repeat protein [Marinoscillum sp. MHG1-6]|uniref:tetratricopeptide repeat protein n=1 Tax=Marinoscillum sp. MHG1-6 TaxID=2959627 RepID=UPI002157870F|nr:tetratricopeptide repeat protein [Marinoscillum sp. MHG1-6]
MKKYYAFIVVVLLAFGLRAQEAMQEQDSVPFEFSRLAYMYQMAKDYNDPAMARMALYNLISYSPGNTSLLDSLALWYYDYNQMASAALIAQDVVEIDPKDKFAVEIAALSFERLSVLPKAIYYYEKLYLHNNDLGTLYKLAFLQKNAKRYDESNVNVDVIIENPKAAEVMLIFPKTQKEQQEVPLTTCAYRLKGMIQQDQGNVDKAKEYYKKALELTPDFQVLKDELAELDK